jgi:CAAX protease family protein
MSEPLLDVPADPAPQQGEADKSAAHSERRSLLATIFLSPDEPRLRAGWRLLIQSIVLLLLLLCFAMAIAIPYLFATYLPPIAASSAASLGLSTLAEFFAITTSVFLARRLLDHRSIPSLGLNVGRGTILDLGAGTSIALVMMGLVYAVMSAMGWLHFKGFAWQFDRPATVVGQTLLILLIFVVVGWQEEILSRGYQLQTISSGSNLGVGVLIASAIFAFLHLGNPHATWVSTAGLFLAGLLLAFGYVLTGQLWLSIGLHIGWNFFEGVLFGFPVSGLSVYPLMRISVAGPKLWTGGAFGPEAGLVVVPALILGSLLVFAYSSRVRRARAG